MSAYTDGRPTQILPFPNANEDSINQTLSGAFNHLESFLVATKKLEASLAREKAQVKKLQDELSDAQLNYSRLLSESESRVREVSASENKAKAALGQYKEYETRVKAHAQALVTELKKTRSELERYKRAWSEVMQREREAKMIIAEGNQSRERVRELEQRQEAQTSKLAEEQSRRLQAERHVQNYQKELQSTLVRLHSAEARFHELSKEIQVAHQAKRNFEEEVARVEASMRERFKMDLIKDRERLRAELEKNAALEREQFREEARIQTRAEMDRSLNFERSRFSRSSEQLQAEVTRLAAAVEEAKKGQAEAVGESEALRIELMDRLAQSNLQNEKLRQETQLLKSSDRATQAQVDALTQALSAERQERVKVIADIMVQLGRFQEENPFTETLSSIEAEVVRAQTAVRKMKPGTSEHTQGLANLDELFDYRDQLRGKVEEFEKNIEALSAKVRAAALENVHSSRPVSQA